MTGLLLARWRSLLAGFWFVPGAVALLLAGSALVFVAIDRAAGRRGFEVAFHGDASAARDILSTISGSLITVAGLTFSLTIVVLTLVSSQFTPRALRGFLGDRVNQVVAGGFVGMFLYCLLVLRTVTGEQSGDAFVPSLSVTVAIGYGILTLVLLLMFVHHMGQSIQASHITARIARQTLATVDRRFPHPVGEHRREQTSGGEWSSPPASVVRPPRAGYVQLVKTDEILNELTAGVVAEVPVRPGDFVTERDALIRLWGPAVDDDLVHRLRKTVPVDSERELHDDETYGIRQLADIALKALSPGINDPTTASTCIGYLTAVLERLAGRALPAETVRRQDAAVLAVRHRVWEEYVDVAFSEIGRYGRDNSRIVVLLLGCVGAVARAAADHGAVERLGACAEVAESIADAGADAARTERNREQVEAARQRLRAELTDASVGAGR